MGDVSDDDDGPDDESGWGPDEELTEGQMADKMAGFDPEGIREAGYYGDEGLDDEDTDGDGGGDEPTA